MRVFCLEVLSYNDLPKYANLPYFLRYKHSHKDFRRYPGKSHHLRTHTDYRPSILHISQLQYQKS